MARSILHPLPQAARFQLWVLGRFLFYRMEDTIVTNLKVAVPRRRHPEWLVPVLVTGLAGLAAAVATTSAAQAQGARCTGNSVVNQAPYGCMASKVIDGISFGVTLNVDSGGRAVVDVVMSPAQPTDVPISVHSYTGVSQSPSQFVDGSIPAGATTGQIVVAQIECGQFDVKAVHTAPGAAAGHVTGPWVTWGAGCQVPATTTTATPTTATPTTATPTTGGASTVASPAGVTSPSANVLAETESASGPRSASTIPVTGGVGPLWMWAAGLLGLASVLILISRRRGSALG
jgi:hypothetical protein